VVAALFACTASHAAPARAKKPKPALKVAPKPVPVAAPAVAPVAPLFDKSATSSELLEKVKALYGSLDYDKVIPVAEAALAREDLGVEQRLEVYRLYGSAKAIVEDPADAEKPFRMLLRSRPDYELPAGTPPKILAVFRKVQSEEKALSAQLREVERARIVSGLKLLGEPPATARGGAPLALSYRLRDPTGAVDSIRVPYRRSGEHNFSALALQRSEDGDWRGQIPGEFTASEQGFALEYYVETLDPSGTLLSLGTEHAPKRIEVTAGRLKPVSPPPLPRWAFFTGVGVTAVSGVAAGGLGLALSSTQGSYRQQTAASGVIDGAQLARQARTGEQLATATNAALITAGVALVATAVMAPFVNWRNEP
jgi:hypothetical protein